MGLLAKIGLLKAYPFCTGGGGGGPSGSGKLGLPKFNELVGGVPHTIGGGKGGGEGSRMGGSSIIGGGKGGGGGVSPLRLYLSISFCKSDICLSISSRMEDFSGVSELAVTELDRMEPEL